MTILDGLAQKGLVIVAESIDESIPPEGAKYRPVVVPLQPPGYDKPIELVLSLRTLESKIIFAHSPDKPRHGITFLGEFQTMVEDAINETDSIKHVRAELSEKAGKPVRLTFL